MERTFTRDQIVSIGGELRCPAGKGHRLYINGWARMINLVTEYHLTTGKIKYAEVNGERISSTVARELERSSVYFDLRSNQIFITHVAEQFRDLIIQRIGKKVDAIKS